VGWRFLSYLSSFFLLLLIHCLYLVVELWCGAALSDQLKAEIAVEDAEKEALHLRKKLNKLERMSQQPPRLGKHKFKPEPLQVNC
jgi:hypothetical protein